MKPGESCMVGPYMVRLQESAACPSAMPLHYVFRDGEFIGKSLSMPDLDACRWLEHSNREGTLHASVSAAPKAKHRR